LKTGGSVKIFLVVLFILIFCVPAFSNPPADITINISGSNLEVFVLHPSQNTAKHFIKTIKVFLNEKEVINQDFSGQDKDGQRKSVSLPGLKKSDKIKIWAECSIYGDLEKEFPVG
jgi:desulfoferrodoxin (superoxide reductase-like protein)